MAATKTRRKQFSPEQKAAYIEGKRAEQRERIEAAARELLTSEGWAQFARFRSSFRKYSFGNVLLIAHQCPDATRVTGFRTWQSLGRQVRKGERAIMISAPSTKKVEDPETGEEVRRVFFRSVPVFDVSQTDGDPLPEPPPVEPITGDSHAAYFAKLDAFARTLGYRVEGEALADGHGGYCDEAKKRIVVSTALGSENARVRVLVHELAHALGVGYKEFGRRDAEVIVETAAIIACASIGLDTSGEAIPYIVGWGERNDLEAITKYAETVDAIARQLELAVLGGEEASS